nr:integrase, catalytic region, zinc finger, CCHC-type, peptidase aspartic, catalytic [Tanacetum cinerariifolium]
MELIPPPMLLLETAEEKKTRKIDRLARSLLIQGLPNDIYSLIDSNETAKDLWDALERQMRGSEYDEQDRKAVILYKYETFKATEGEQLLDTYLRYLQVINDLKKCGYKKDNCDVNDALGYKKKVVVKVEVQTESEESDDKDISDLKKITRLLAKAFNRKKYYAKPTNNNLRTSSASFLANKKPEYVKSVEKKEDKKADEKKRDMCKVKCYNCKKEGHFAKDYKKAKDKDYNYYKTKMLLAKKDSDEQVLLDSDESSSSAEETIAEVAYYTSESENKSEVDHNDSEEKEHLIDKLIWKFNHKIAKCRKCIEKANQQSKDLENQNKDLQEKYDVLINQVNTFKEQNNEFNEQIKVLTEKNADLLAQMEVLQDQLKQVSSLKPYVLTVILEKIIIDLEDEVVSLLENEKANLETIESLKSKDLDTFSIVRRPKCSGVICKKKGSSNTFNVDLSSVSHSKLNKDVKRYSRKDLLSCNNSHLGETSSAYVCNDMNVSSNYRLCDSFDENNLYIFDDESVRISPVSKMSFRKKPRDSMNVRSKSKSNKSLPRTMHRWLPKMQSLAEPVVKWIPRIVQICLWIINSGCSKHMTGNHALLTNFVEKFLGMVRFGNNDFAVFVGYEDVVIGSMTIKKVYYVKGLGHNLFSVGKFCDKGLEVAFRKSTCFVQNEDGVDLLTGDCSSNLYTIALNKVASNSSTCLLAKASSFQSWLWHQRLSHLNFTTINNLVKNNLVQASEVIIFFIKKPQVNLQLQVQRVRTNNGTEFKNETLAKFFDEIMKSSTINVKTSNVEIPSHEEEVFHESSSFPEESSSSSLNDDVQQSSKEVRVPSSNTQSISNNMVPNVDEVSTSHNVFNERLDDAYFDATDTLKDVDWVSAMQDELDQFARLEVWRLVPRPEGTTIIKTKWIFKNKKDETIRLFFAYAAHKDFIVFQMDVKAAFLNRVLKEEVYVSHPPGFVSKQYPDHVYALDKALYGLKQAP